MSDAYSERAMQGGAAAPLTNEQKKSAVLLARRAFDLLQGGGAIGEAVTFDNWRHGECMQCVERGGLTFAAQSDWPYIQAHFAALISRHTGSEAERRQMDDLAFNMGKKAINQDASFADRKSVV